MPRVTESAGGALDVSDLLGLLSSRDRATAAGAAAAVAGAIAASLVAKAARYSEQPGLLAQADALATRLTVLASEDIAAYGDAVGALADAGDGGSPSRDFQLGRLVTDAAAVTVAIAEASADVAVLAAHLTEVGDPNLRPDGVAAGLLAAGAARAAAHLTESSLTAHPEDKLVLKARAAAAAAERAIVVEADR